MTLNTPPELWNSVHRAIPFIYDYESRNADLFVSGGFLLIGLDSSFTETLAIGDKIAIEGSIVTAYNTIHTVTAIAGTLITTSTTAAGADTDVTVKLISIPEIKLYSGYATSEEYPDDLPLTLVATFTPENSPDNDIRFDVSEYLKSIFRIVAPSEGIDFSMFNRFRLFFDGVYHETYQVLNSSIETDLLMSDYANTGNPLNSKFPPLVFGCGRTIISFLENNIVTNYVSINDDIIQVEGDYYVGDYAAADYYTN